MPAGCSQQLPAVAGRCSVDLLGEHMGVKAYVCVVVVVVVVGCSCAQLSWQLSTSACCCYRCVTWSVLTAAGCSRQLPAVAHTPYSMTCVLPCGQHVLWIISRAAGMEGGGRGGAAWLLVVRECACVVIG